jgi:cytoskeletal protein CcmA (bactofilin family)
MFNKTADPTSAPTPPAPRANTPPAGNAARSVLAADLRITGEITSSGAIDLMGQIDGTLAARSIVVGTEGRLTGTVTADTVEVKGRLDGKVTSDAFTMRASAQVTADVVYQTLIIESGATIEGSFSYSGPKS